MSQLFRDLRFAVRLWRKRLLTTSAAIACLALGIGATTMMFSLVDNTLLRPLPYEDANELVTLWTQFPGQNIPRSPSSGPEYLDFREQLGSLEYVVGYIPWAFNLTAGDDPERLAGARVSSALFRMLGASPLEGRVFGPDEEKREERVAIISQALYERRFAADPSIIGSAIPFENIPYTVIGVMPADFQFLSASTQVWVPLEINPRIRRDQRGMRIVGRLADGVSLDQAQADANGVAARLTESFPNFYPPETGFGIRVIPLQDIVVGDVRPLLWTLLAAVVLVLLIGCSNVANLLLTQATTREREISLRAALGAGRGRLVSQLLTESMLLALVGGALGIGLAYLGTAAAVRVGLGGLPRLNEVSVDGRILLFALAVSCVTGIVFGIVPAIKSSQVRLFEVLKDEGRSSSGGRRNSLRSVLVIAQIALALIVLVGSGLVIRSYQRIKQVDPGFRPESVLTARFALPLQRYFQPPQRVAFADRLVGELRSAPGVESVGTVSLLPFSGTIQKGEIAVIGRSKEENQASPQVGWRMVSPGYLETLGIPLLRGRSFNDLDHAEAAPVVILDRNLADRLWPDGNALGQRIQLIGSFGGDPERTIVGVAGTINELNLETASELLYIPFAQKPTPGFAVVMRVRGEPESAVGAVRGAARVADPNLPIVRIASMTSLVDASLDRRKFNRLMFSLFGGAALLLTTIGVYSVMAYSVAQRRQEIGLRSALGATPESLRTLVLGQSLRLAAIGIVGGVALAIFMTRVLADNLATLTFGIGLVDGLTYVAAPLLLALLALAASYIPAWSASRIDPIVALRQE